MSHSVVFRVALLLSIAGVLIHGEFCSVNTDCYSCTTASVGSCGWCQSGSYCASGTATGPNSGSCATWDWLSSDCPATPAPAGDNCGQWTDCKDCTSAPSDNCGWCQDSSRCSKGTALGPSSGQCTSYWHWTPSQCKPIH